MRKTAAILTLALVTGCGHYGQPLLLAHLSDSADPCQMYNKPAGHRPPEWCGAADGRQKWTTRDYRTGRYLTTTSGNLPPPPAWLTRDYRTGRYLTTGQQQ